MSYRSTRDWRGIKHQLGEYSTDDLLRLIKNAEHTREQMRDFTDHVVAELARRGVATQAAAA